MAEEMAPLVFTGGQSNYYVRDVEGMAAFYRDNFGFKETYRTPLTGAPEHVELRLGEYLIGLSSVEAGRRLHRLALDPGKPRGEIVLWCNDVDQAHAMLMAKRVQCSREPHNFDVNEQLRLRVAWYANPEGNIFQTVCPGASAGTHAILAAHIYAARNLGSRLICDSECTQPTVCALPG